MDNNHNCSVAITWTIMLNMISAKHGVYYIYVFIVQNVKPT